MSVPRMSPRSQAIAFRIWQYAEPKGWDCTTAEIATALNVGTIAVVRICQLKKWNNRLRHDRPNAINVPMGDPLNRLDFTASRKIETPADYAE